VTPAVHAGHYLSATAKMWASTHNGTLAGRMSAVVDALDECQRAGGTGYLSAFPAEFFDRFEAIKPVWAPYYTIHKARRGRRRSPPGLIYLRARRPSRAAQ
jgi:uncharacterized protein